MKRFGGAEHRISALSATNSVRSTDGLFKPLEVVKSHRMTGCLDKFCLPRDYFTSA